MQSSANQPTYVRPEQVTTIIDHLYGAGILVRIEIQEDNGYSVVIIDPEKPSRLNRDMLGYPEQMETDWLERFDDEPRLEVALNKACEWVCEQWPNSSFTPWYYAYIKPKNS